MASTEGYRLLFKQGHRMLAACVRREVASSQARQARFRPTTPDSVQNLGFKTPKRLRVSAGWEMCRNKRIRYSGDKGGSEREYECRWRRERDITVPCSRRSTSAKGKGQRNARRCWTPCQKLSLITDSFRRRCVVRYLHITSMENDRCKKVSALINHRQMSAF